nr:hypothetical protein [uncultured Rhodococcus sp.]
MTTTLPLPPLVGTRKRARTLVESLPPDLESKIVVVDCRDLMAATESFADELITRVLVDRRAAQMHFVNVSDLEFANWADERARFHHVSDRVKIDRRPS